MIKRFIAIFVIFCTFSCATVSSLPEVTPEDLKRTGANINKALDINIVEFNPGINSDPKKNEIAGIWPELRRSESRIFADKLKKSFENTNKFGDVNIVSSNKFLSDVVVTGKILESNGEDLILQVSATDSTGKKFIKDKKYSHRTNEYFFRDLRNKDKDPFDPVYDSITLDVMKYLQNEDLDKIQKITELRFANDLNSDYFKDSLTKNRRNTYDLNFIPDESDPTYIKAKNVKIQDNIFKREMQDTYSVFLDSLDEGYVEWRKAAFTISKQKREAEAAANAAAVAGILIAVAGAAASADSYDGYSYDYGQDLTGTLAMAAGAALIYQSTQDRAEANRLSDTITEISKSFDAEVAPKVIEFEGVTLSVEGSISDQFDEWQKIMKTYYDKSLSEGRDIVIKS